MSFVSRFFFKLAGTEVTWTVALVTTSWLPVTR